MRVSMFQSFQYFSSSMILTAALMNSLTDVVLARVATEKKHSLIRAWEESEKSKAENKYVVHFLVEL